MRTAAHPPEEDDGNVYGYKNVIPKYADFAHDVRSGTLPAYSFIEPRYQKFSLWGYTFLNSNHSGNSTMDDFDRGLPPINICHGERLLNVFKTLSSNQDLFKKTLLIITSPRETPPRLRSWT